MLNYPCSIVEDVKLLYNIGIYSNSEFCNTFLRNVEGNLKHVLWFYGFKLG
jgi:hypothetical protein